jgi:tetratricopeptide (TPR) repeat protein
VIDGWLIAGADRPLGTGGFGAVWRVTHATLGVSAALKVMTHPSWQSPEGKRAFRDEVRAMGLLDHPNVVRVLDHGEVGTGGPLPEGAPWLVMELIDGATLAAAPLAGWPALRAVIGGALDGLAHAHALGLVHGDVSPANVLVERSGRARLTDFGLARAFAAESRPGVRDAIVRGTRPYMAPEQREGRFRDLGPWTDLFSLAAVIWERVTGSPPRTSPPGPFQPRFPTPPGLEAWLRRLLEPHPGARWAWAADAAHALPSGEGSHPILPGPPGAATAVATSPETAAVATATAFGTVEGASADEEASTGAWVRSSAPPLPAWSGADREVEPPSVQLLRMGGGRSGLFGLRRLPLLGREAERRALWEALRAVVGSGKPDAVVLTGPAGVGKTRLARWLLERAHEAGAAYALEAVPDAHGDGLSGLVRRAAVLGGLDRGAAEARLRSWLRPLGLTDAWDAATLAAVAAGADVPPGDRRLAVRRMVQRLAGVRPVVLLVDDAPDEPDALAVAEALLGSGAPILAVVTANDDARIDRPVLADTIDALASRRRRIAVGPLPAADHALLVRELFGLAPDLASVVEARTAGNPEFAVQLVGTWVDRGALALAPDGWRLGDGVEAPMPEDLRASWRARLERFLAAEPAGSGPALEVAAALGNEVLDEEWRAVLGQAGVDAPEGLAERLVAAGLALRQPAGFVFAHGMARLALQDRAGDRWIAWNRAATAWIGEGRPRDLTLWPADALERGSRFAEAAGDLRLARDLCSNAARSRGTRAEYRVALELALRVLSLLRRLGTPESDEIWGRALHTVIDLRLMLGQHELVASQLEEALAEAVRHGWGAARGWLLRDRGLLRQTQGDEAGMLADLRDANGLFRAHGDLRGEASMLQLAGDAERLHGRLDAAIVHYRDAAALHERCGSRDFVAVALVSLAAALILRGRLAEAEEAIVRGLRVCAETGASQVAAYGTYFLGAVRVRQLRLDEGERLVGDAIARLDRFGNAAGVMFARGVLAHADRLRGRFDRAYNTLGEIVAFFERVGADDRLDFLAEQAWVRLDEGRDAEAAAIVRQVLARRSEAPPGGLGLAGLIGMVAAARTGDLAAYDLAYAAAQEGLERSGAADRERLALARASVALLQDAHPERAAAAADLAKRVESAFSAARPATAAEPPGGPGGAAPRGA